MRTVVLAACLAILASPVLANHIGIYADLDSYCTIKSVAPAPTLNEFYVIVGTSTAITAAAYRIQPGLPAALLVVSGQDLSCPGICEPVPIPDPFGSGAFTIPRDCSVGNWPVWRYTVLWFGAPFPCTSLSVVAHAEVPGPGPVVYDCNQVAIPATGGTFTIGPPGACGTCTVATESRTWGSIKSLYR